VGLGVVEGNVLWAWILLENFPIVPAVFIFLFSKEEIEL